jgi:hypothetical protein
VVSFPQVSPALISFIRATCPAHLSLLALITRMIFGDEYRAYRNKIYTRRKISNKSEWVNLSSLQGHDAQQLHNSVRVQAVASRYKKQELWDHKKAQLLLVKSTRRPSVMINLGINVAKSNSRFLETYSDTKSYLHGPWQCSSSGGRLTFQVRKF